MWSTFPLVNHIQVDIVLVTYSIEKKEFVVILITLFRAGARHETAENRGAAATVRSYAGLSTERFTQFGIIRNIQQAGGSLSVSGDREITAFTLVATRDQIEGLLPYLAQVACSPAFKVNLNASLI